MDRARTASPRQLRKWSSESGASTLTGGSSSPGRHSRSSSISGLSNIKRTQNVAAKAAALRLAQVMASQAATGNDDENDDDDDLGFRFAAPSFSRSNVRTADNGTSAILSAKVKTRSSSPAVISVTQVSYPNLKGKKVEPSQISLQIFVLVLFRSDYSSRHGIVVKYLRILFLARNFVEESLSLHSTSAGRLTVPSRPPPSIPSSRQPVKTPSPITPIDPPTNKLRKKRFCPDLRQVSLKYTGDRRAASALHDELDMLQEENENILGKLRVAETSYEGAEARVKELEKQAALKDAKQAKNGIDVELASLRSNVQKAKDDAAAAVDQLQGMESEVKALRSMTQRMILTPNEMEDVVLKRCWLARYWGLAAQFAICPDIAASKHEYWSSFAPLPFELVISAGQKAKEEYDDNPEREKLVQDLNDLTGEGNIESMLSVEMGLNELVSLKVEDAIVLALAQQRRPNSARTSISDIKSPSDPKYMEAFGTMAEEGKIPNSIIQVALASIMEKLNVMDSRLGLTEGDVSNLKEHQNSIPSTPQNYHTFFSGHSQNTSTTITSETLHQMFNPPRHLHDAILTQITEIPFVHNNPNSIK
ncbi:hypothetical protein BC332_28353 [Capsicum chinense]|nr:hypothetical protein BC332_28353 [Capsicum chinense]